MHPRSRNKVVLPVPFAPSNVTTEPPSIEMVTSLNIFLNPILFDNPFMETCIFSGSIQKLLADH